MQDAKTLAESKLSRHPPQQFKAGETANETVLISLFGHCYRDNDEIVLGEGDSKNQKIA